VHVSQYPVKFGHPQVSMSLLKKNAIVASGVIISNGLAFVFHFVAGRMLGPDEYGELGALLAMLLVIGLPLSALNSTVTKFISKLNSTNPESIRKLKHKFQRDASLTSGILILAIFLFRDAISSYLNLDNTYIVVVIAITGLASLLLGINRGVSLGVQNYKQFSYNMIIESFVRLLALVALVQIGWGAPGGLTAFSLAYLVAFLILEFSHRKKFAHRKKTDLSRKELYRFLGIMLVVQIVIQGSINLPTLYIKHVYSNQFTGYWNAALTISRTILLVTMAVSMVLFTETAGRTENQKPKDQLLLSTILVLLGSGIIAVLFYYFPEFFLQLLFGKEFIGAADILRWMGFAMIGFSLLDLWSKYYLAKMK